MRFRLRLSLCVGRSCRDGVRWATRVHRAFYSAFYALWHSDTVSLKRSSDLTLKISSSFQAATPCRTRLRPTRHNSICVCARCVGRTRQWFRGRTPNLHSPSRLGSGRRRRSCSTARVGAVHFWGDASFCRSTRRWCGGVTRGAPIWYDAPLADRPLAVRPQRHRCT